MKKSVTRSLVLLLVLPFLGACQTERMLAKCPSSGILAETSTMSVFARGKAMVPANFAYRVELRRATTSCSIDKDEHTTESDLELLFSGYRPHAGAAAEYNVPFFVAINDSDGNLILKKTYSARLAFGEGQTRVNVVQPVESLKIRMPRSKQAFDYHLIVGLQLTKEQLEYNRKYSQYAQ